MTRVRWYYYAWYSVFYLLTVGVGLLARLYLTDGSAFDAELALPLMSLELLPEILVGIVLAGLFAATMSTADSQILSCSAALTRDLFIPKKHTYIMTKVATIGVALVSLLVALVAPANVFDLVLIAWSGLGSAFGPLLILYASRRVCSEQQALCVVGSGFAVALVWRYVGLNTYVYEALPGIICGLVIGLILFKLKLGAVQES
jgi:Na+/proline symporter